MATEILTNPLNYEKFCTLILFDDSIGIAIIY